ncbi:MAG: AbrB/MazE/SpoVT family DNA-binding domain-containing protein [Reyranella sp.]|uniref:AbrB/MazE/SpoVT family DNA-binding domain-containing protein n=1 Tax=Reyranella sp. TaxID=1929291 RepID=UPI003D13B8A5
MSRAIVRRWGKNLAVRVPHDVVERTGLVDGERVAVEEQDGNIEIRRAASTRDAIAAAEETINERLRYRRDRRAISRLIAEGRRGHSS